MKHKGLIFASPLPANNPSDESDGQTQEMFQLLKFDFSDIYILLEKVVCLLKIYKRREAEFRNTRSVFLSYHKVLTSEETSF